MLPETNIFIKMSNFWMNTPSFPAMYMYTFFYQATKLKSKHTTAVGPFSKDRNDS